MDNFSVKELKEAIDRSQSVGICVGSSSGIDEMAAGLSLYLALKAYGKGVSVSSPAEPTVEISSLVGVNKLSKELESDNGPLVVSFPYKEGEIEKISYTMENGVLNIVVKPGENGLTFRESDVSFRRTGDAPEMLVVVGTPRLSDLGGLFNPEGLKDTTVVNIDNKQENQGFGDIVMVSARASSVSELVADILLSLNLDIDQDMAQNLLYGITFATDNFQKPTTSSLAFETASIMMQKGAVRRNLAKREAVRDEFADLARNFPPPPPPPFPKVKQPFPRPTQPGRMMPPPFAKPLSQASPGFQPASPSLGGRGDQAHAGAGKGNQSKFRDQGRGQVQPQANFPPPHSSGQDFPRSDISGFPPPFASSPSAIGDQSGANADAQKFQPPFQAQDENFPDLGDQQDTDFDFLDQNLESAFPPVSSEPKQSSQASQHSTKKNEKKRFQKNPPDDWLAPKVYKGSSDFQG